MNTAPISADSRGRTSVSDDDVTVVDIIRDAGNPELATALERCLTEPEDSGAWDGLRAAKIALPEVVHVAELYGATLERKLPRAILLDIGAHALRFCDEWALPDDTRIRLLDRVLRIDPTVGWAFERLSLELATSGRYEDLLAYYDMALDAAVGSPRHAALLAEAADVARDGAGDVDRAVVYQGRLLALEPHREAIAASLERLLAQKGRHQELLAHWQRRMEIEGPARAVAIRCRAAQFCLETMDDPFAAAAMLLPLSADGDDPIVSKLLETILDAPAASLATRSAVLSQLRSRYDRAGTSAELIRPLRALLLHDGSDHAPIHAEIVQLLVAEGRDAETLDHLAALLVQEPKGNDDPLVERLVGDTSNVELAGCLPRLGRDERREVVRRAAGLAASQSERVDWAIRLYGVLLAAIPSDTASISGLAQLYSLHGRRAELIVLRRHELSLTTEPAARRLLKLEIADLSLVLADTPSAVASLEQILDEQPEDIEAIGAVLSTLEKHDQQGALCDLSECHAARIASSAPGLALGLWGKAAAIAETRLADRRRALVDHGRIVGVSPEAASLDALARIHTELGEHAPAVDWLEKLLAVEEVDVSVRTNRVLRLAAAHIAAGEPTEALACVEERLGTDPEDFRLHQVGLELRRPRPDREALVTALVAAAPHAEPRVAASLLCEAAQVLVRELEAAGRAAGLLADAVRLHADVQSLALFADTLHRAGQREEARAVAKRALAEFGLRHPPERAAVHFLLGRIAHERGDGDEARRELESAVKTDMTNVEAHLLLGKLCREAGEYGRSERALHAALLLQRRGREEASPPRSETLVLLHRVAIARGDEERAAESLAAALDMAAVSARERHGLKDALREAGMREPLLLALERHLAATVEPLERVAVLREIAVVLGSLGRHDEAIEVALRGLSVVPADPELHRLARSACIAKGRIGRYAEALESLVGAALEAGDGVVGSSLLLLLGEVLEEDLGLPDAAEAAYARAEDTSENLVRVWQKRVRLASRRGDRATELAVLLRLADSAEELGVTERADTLYALASLELGAVSTLDAGLSSLALAMAVEPRPERLAAALRGALAIADDRAPFANFYEEVAREHGNDSMLLDALEAQASLVEPSQALLQEAHEVASRQGAPERALRILERAVSVARDAGDPAEALWALRLLAEGSEERGDLPSALAWAEQAARAAGSEESTRFSLRAAALATSLGERQAALDSYERVLADDPSHPKALASMLDLYRLAGDPVELEAALMRATEESRDPAQRVLLHMERAHLLLEDQARASDAMDALKAVLEEEPDHVAAMDHLTGLLSPDHDRDELVALLFRRLEVAEEQKDAVAPEVALRLAGLTPPEQALDVVRSALTMTPAHAALLRRLLELTDGEADAAERAAAIEALLAHLDNLSAQRVGLAADLVRARMSARDPEGTERAVEVLSASRPGHPQIMAALEWLARTRIAEAEERPKDSARLFCAAARFQQRLGDKERALLTLARAHAAAPDDLDVLDVYARALLEHGKHDLALAVVSAAAQRPSEPRVYAARLAMRASLRTALGDHEGAVADLEEAQRRAGGWYLELIDALDRAREAAQAEDAMRALSLREADVLEAVGRVDDARDLLAGLGDTDARVLTKLLALDIGTGHWASAAVHGEFLMDLTEGRELARVAATVAGALERIGRADEARSALERAHAADLSDESIFERLRDVYVGAGSFRELASCLLARALRTTDAMHRFERLVEVGQLRLEVLGEAAAAIGPLSEALEIRPEEPWATSLLVDAFARSGLIDDAVALLDDAIKRQGPRRCRELSDLQRRMGNVVRRRDSFEALPWFVLAFDGNPKSQEAATELAELAVALDELDVALRALRALTGKTFEPEVRARAYVAQAAIALRQGNEGKAEAFAKKAAAEAPHLSEVSAFMHRLERESRASSFDLALWVDLSAISEPQPAGRH